MKYKRGDQIKDLTDLDAVLSDETYVVWYEPGSGVSRCEDVRRWAYEDVIDDLDAGRFYYAVPDGGAE